MSTKKFVLYTFLILLVAASILAIGNRSSAVARSASIQEDAALSAAGFRSQFTTNMAGWSKIKGVWTVISKSKYVRTPGLANYYASIAHTGRYTTLNYRAKIKRTGCSSCANALIIRGTPARLSISYGWYRSYSFQYTNGKSFSIWKNVNGMTTMLKGWTSYSGINANNWNTLRVTAKGSALKFYINNKLVWSGTDTSLSRGLVGIRMYRDTSAGNKFYVDWATLSTTVAKQDDEPLAETGAEILNWNNPDMSPAP